MDFVPLIGGAKEGPLGIVHLPRLWFKLRAYAAGVLPAGYRHGNGGTDDVLVETFGIDPGTFLAYITADEPDYQACEAWIASHAADLAPAAIAAFNADVLGLQMPEPRRSEWLARFGLTGGAYDRAVELNQLDDWAAIHAQLVATDAPAMPLVPAISSSATGPLGVLHLPRLWLKHLAHSVGRLQAGYRHGPGGFDEMLTDAFGIDRVLFAEFVATERPEYLAAEAWVREFATALTPATIAAFATKLQTSAMREERAAERRAELGIDDSSVTLGIPLNDLDDWAGVHRQLLAIAH